MLCLTALTLGAPAARAGYYSLAISGGQYADRGGNPHPDTQSGTEGGADYSTPDGDTASASGTFTVNCTWVPDGPGDAPPQDVILDETGYAYYESNGPTLDGTSDDGLGDPAVSGVNGPAYALSGSYDLDNDHYKVHPGGPSFTLTHTATVSGGGDNCGSLLYSVDVYPITIDLSGPMTDTDGSLKLLAGQQVTASLNGGPGDLSDFSWTVDADNIYGAYDTSQSAAQLQPVDRSESSVFFYDEKDKDVITVSCTATITFSDGTTGSVSATAPTISVLKPKVTRWDINQIPDVDYEWDNFDSGGSPQYGVREIWAPITITVPPPFSATNGGACIAQIWKDCTFLDKRAKKGEVSYQGQMLDIFDKWVPIFGLDCSYPYPFTDSYTTATDTNGDVVGSVSPNGYPFWGAPGTGAAEDNPFIPCAPPLVSGDTDPDWHDSGGQDDFSTWVMYSPDGASWVPLSKISWSFLGGATISSTGVWQGGGGTSSSGASATDEFPEWDAIAPYSGTGGLRMGPVPPQ